jgi:AraC-type DNA-binding domain-containing proteins
MNEFYIFEDIEFTEKIPVKYFIAAIEESWAHWHNEIEILFILSGTLQITVEEAKYDLKAGDIILINSNQIHSITGKDDLTFVLQFVPELIYKIYGNQELYRFNLNTADSSLKKESTDKLKSILAKIGIEYSKRRDGFKFYLWSYIYELVGYIFRYCNYETVKNDLIKTEDLKKVSAIINHINGNFNKFISMKTIAEALNMSDLTLGKFFKEKTGLSVMFYLQIVRINHAKQLLESSEASIIDVAQDCGFYSLPTFYRVFNKIVGISPSEYKKTKQHHVFKNHLQLVQGYLVVDSINEYALLYKYL